MKYLAAFTIGFLVAMILASFIGVRLNHINGAFVGSAFFACCIGGLCASFMRVWEMGR